MTFLARGLSPHLASAMPVSQRPCAAKRPCTPQRLCTPTGPRAQQRLRTAHHLCTPHCLFTLRTPPQPRFFFERTALRAKTLHRCPPHPTVTPKSSARNRSRAMDKTAQRPLGAALPRPKGRATRALPPLMPWKETKGMIENTMTDEPRSHRQCHLKSVL